MRFILIEDSRSPSIDIGISKTWRHFGDWVCVHKEKWDNNQKWQGIGESLIKKIGLNFFVFIQLSIELSCTIVVHSRLSPEGYEITLKWVVVLAMMKSKNRGGEESRSRLSGIDLLDHWVGERFSESAGLSIFMYSLRDSGESQFSGIIKPIVKVDCSRFIGSSVFPIQLSRRWTAWTVQSSISHISAVAISLRIF